MLAYGGGMMKKNGRECGFMQMIAVAMAALVLLGGVQVPATGEAAGPAWEAVAEQVLEAEPAAAAETLLRWAEAGGAAPEGEVEALLAARDVIPADAAASFAAVLDEADALLAEGGAPGLSREDYRAAVRSLSPFFTRLLETETTPWREEPADWPEDLAGFEGIWLDSDMGELLIFRAGRCRVVIPWLGSGYYGETAYAARLRDRSEVGYAPSLEVDTHETGSFQGPLAYYVSGLDGEHFWCNSQAQRFDRLWGAF